MSLLNRGASSIDRTLSATGKAKSLNPDAAEFVPLALRSPPGNTNVADTSSDFSNFGTSKPEKSILNRSESYVSNNSDDEALQFWRHQLPDDITPDFKVVREEQSQGINSISFSNLSIAEKMRYSLPEYGENGSAANFQLSSAKRWDMHDDQLVNRILDGPFYNGGSGQGYVDDIINEQQQMDGTEVNSLDYLASRFPGFTAESLAKVYYANGCDLNLTVEMINQLELDVDNGLNQNLNSKAFSAPNRSALDFPALPHTENRNNVPTFSPRDQLKSVNSYHSLGATDFASAVRKMASQDSSIWKYDRTHSPTSTIESSRGSHTLSNGYGGGGGYGERMVNRSSSRSAPVWLETGDAVANMYSEMRGEARDHARLRNAYFEQARQAYLVGHKTLAKELSVKGQLHNMQMKAAHENAQESFYYQRNPFGPNMQG